jgi:hypothetical protein
MPLDVYVIPVSSQVKESIDDMLKAFEELLFIVKYKVCIESQPKLKLYV